MIFHVPVVSLFFASFSRTFSSEAVEVGDALLFFCVCVVA